MKRIILIVALSIFSLSAFSQEVEVLNIYGEEYNVMIAEDYDQLREGYIRVMTAYLEEAKDFENLQLSFDNYVLVTDELIESKNELIRNKDELIVIKDQRIKQLQDKQDWFSIIPSVYYSISENGSSGGAGVGILLWDSLFVQVQGGYPLEARFGLGWKF